MNPRLLLFAGCFTSCCALATAADPAAESPPPAGEIAITAYRSLGFDLGEQSRFADLGWTEMQMEAFLSGVRDSFHRQPAPVSADAAALQKLVTERLLDLQRKEKVNFQAMISDPAQREAFMKRTCKAYQFERTDSGLGYRIVAQGGGARPEPADRVVVTYAARAADAQTELPDLETKQKELRVSDLPPGLAEAAQMISPGATIMLLVPPELSFGDGHWPPGVERGSPLFFVLTLHTVLAPK